MEAKQPYNLSIKQYNGTLTIVSELAQLIERNYPEMFHSVIVHGSVATNEVIPYSDFDGLLIVKDQHAGSKQLEAFKSESMKIIYRFDPLQHHGWFQLLESDLKNYPEDYLPVSTLERAKLIYPNEQRLELELLVKQNVDYKSNLLKMIEQFEKRDAINWRPANLFQLKSVLSQVMLIPCLYYSTIYNDGIFKKESFEAVRSDFTDLEWMSIACATDIRANWDYSLSSVQKQLLGFTGKLNRKITTRFFAPKIPKELQLKLNDQFYGKLPILVNKIKKDIL